MPFFFARFKSEVLGPCLRLQESLLGFLCSTCVIIVFMEKETQTVSLYGLACKPELGYCKCSKIWVYTYFISFHDTHTHT